MKYRSASLVSKPLTPAQVIGLFGALATRLVAFALTLAVQFFLHHLVDELIPIVAGFLAEFFAEILSPARDRARVVLVEAGELGRIGQRLEARILGFDDCDARDRPAHIGITTARAGQSNRIAKPLDQLLKLAVAVWADVFVDWHMTPT